MNAVLDVTVIEIHSIIRLQLADLERLQGTPLLGRFLDCSEEENNLSKIVYPCLGKICKIFLCE